MLSCASGDEVPARHVGCLCHQPEIRSLTRRIGADLSRRGFVAGMTAAVAAAGLPGQVFAQSAPARPRAPILFTNTRVFDGRSDALRDGLRILVEEDQIKAVAGGDHPAPDGARVIDCGGRVLMPGLIDVHWHCLFASLPPPVAMAAD